MSMKQLSQIALMFLSSIYKSETRRPVRDAPAAAPREFAVPPRYGLCVCMRFAAACCTYSACCVAHAPRLCAEAVNRTLARGVARVRLAVASVRDCLCCRKRTPPLDRI